MEASVGEREMEKCLVGKNISSALDSVAGLDFDQSLVESLFMKAEK